MIVTWKERVRVQLERHEGRRRRIYVDTVGKVTGGIGRNLTDRSFSDAEIDLMFENDLEGALSECRKLFPTWRELEPIRQAVLTDMMFNLGQTRFSKFKKMRRALRARDFTEAAVQMLDSKWANQVGRKTHQRAWRLARMMSTNEWGS